MQQNQGLRVLITPDLFEPAASSHLDGVYEIAVLKVGPDLYSFDEPVSFEVDITNVGDAFLVSGTADGLGKTSCARCLEPIDIDFFGEIEGYFLYGESFDEELDEEENDFERLPEDKTIDLEPLIRAALVLEAPLMPLCDEDCKGICPDCGANLNDGPCGCVPSSKEFDEAANPFAALADLRFEEDPEQSS